MNGEVIPCETHGRYLGVTLDGGLVWKEQITNMSTKATKAMNILKHLRSTWWGAHPNTMLIFYKAFVKPQLDFGALILSRYSKSKLNKLDKVHFQALRICLGMMRFTPTNVVLSEAAESSLSVRRDYLAMRFLIKSMSIQHNPVTQAVTEMYINYNEYGEVEFLGCRS